MIDIGVITCACGHAANDHWQLGGGCNIRNCGCGASESAVLVAEIEKLRAAKDRTIAELTETLDYFAIKVNGRWERR